MFWWKKNPCNIIVSYRLPALCQYSHHCYHLYLFIAFTFIHGLFVSTTWNHLLAHLLLHTVSIKNTQQSLKLGKQGSNKSREDDFHIYISFLLPTESGWGVHLLCLYLSVCEEKLFFFCETGCFIQYERVSGVARYERAAQEKNPWISIFRVADEEAGRPTLPQAGWCCKHTYLSNRNFPHFGGEFEKKRQKSRK